jgi:site-specific recombinase XerC
MLIGCGLRRGELLALNLKSVQLREEDWVIADLIGKGGHIRTVPIPSWVKTAVDVWTASGEITKRRVFRSINTAGKIWGDGMTRRFFGRSSKKRRSGPASTNSHLMI